MANELIVSDDYIEEMSEFFLNQGQNLENMLDQYLTAVSVICSTNITSGRIHDGLEAYRNAGKSLNGELKMLSTVVSQTLNNFINEIDEVDKYLY